MSGAQRACAASPLFDGSIRSVRKQYSICIEWRIWPEVSNRNESSNAKNRPMVLNCSDESNKKERSKASKASKASCRQDR